MIEIVEVRWVRRHLRQVETFAAVSGCDPSEIRMVEVCHGADAFGDDGMFGEQRAELGRARSSDTARSHHAE